MYNRRFSFDSSRQAACFFVSSFRHFSLSVYANATVSCSCSKPFNRNKVKRLIHTFCEQCRLMNLKRWIIANLLVASLASGLFSNSFVLEQTNYVLEAEFVLSCVIGIVTCNVFVATFALLINHFPHNRLRIITFFECAGIFAFALAPLWFEIIQLRVDYFYPWTAFTTLLLSVISTCLLQNPDQFNKDNYIIWSKLISANMLCYLLEVFAQFLLLSYLFDNFFVHLKADYQLTSGDLFLLLEFALVLIVLAYAFTPFLLSIDYSKEIFFGANTISCIFTMFCLLPFFERPIEFKVFFLLLLCAGIGSRHLFVSWLVITQVQCVTLRINNPLNYSIAYALLLFGRISAVTVWQCANNWFDIEMYFQFTSTTLFALCAIWFLISHIRMFDIIRASRSTRVEVESQVEGEYTLIVQNRL